MCIRDRFATLGPVSKPPFYAVKLEMGALGTNGGAQTNAKSEVLDVNGVIIPGYMPREMSWRELPGVFTQALAEHWGQH